MSFEENEITYLDDKDIAVFLSRLSGTNPQDGSGKVVISYQAFAAEAPEESIDKQTIYGVSNAAVRISMDKLNPGYYVVDIVFKGYNDPELKMLWARLQRHFRNEAEDARKTWLFHFNILEKACATAQMEHEDTLVTCDVYNPLVVYLTREVPDQLTDERFANGELVGGNVVRMVVHNSLLTFSVSDSVDTLGIKGEILRRHSDSAAMDNEEESPESF